VTRLIVVYPQLCTGCGQCQLSCSYAHEGVYWPSVSRIQLVHFEDRCLSVPMTCVYCEKPVCEETCPSGAMSHNPLTGFAQVSEATCIGCKECVNACPFGAAGFNPERRVATRCNLCKGDPECVKVCPSGANRYETHTAATSERRRSRTLGWIWVQDDAEGQKEAVK
jgi:anaerobic carbon-monoxide dehydrogenase iron sulfur subunit